MSTLGNISSHIVKLLIFNFLLVSRRALCVTSGNSDSAPVALTPPLLFLIGPSEV